MTLTGSEEYCISEPHFRISVFPSFDALRLHYCRIRRTIGDIARFVDVRYWDPIAEVKGTPLDGKMSEKNLLRNDEFNWKAGDLMRTVALYKYGGLYADLDVMFVRSFEPLLGEDFVYQWSCYNWQNAAIMLSSRSRGS
jgi:hypothetical protein